MRLNRLDLNQLMILNALLEERSSSKVATRLHVTQPAISASLRKLRLFFGDPLFILTGRAMEPTPFALSLLAPIKEILFNAEGLTRMRPSSDIRTYRRHVTIACSDYIATVVIAPILREARIEAPHLTFEIVSVFSSHQNYHEALDKGDVDILIIPDLFAAAEHPQQFLLEECYTCIVWKGSTEYRRSLSLEKYLAAQHVCIADHTSDEHPYDEVHLRRLAHSRSKQVTVPTLLWIPSMLVGTDRIATIHGRLAKGLAKQWPLRVLPCPAALPPLRELVQWHRFQERDTGLRWLREKLAAVAHVQSRSSTRAARLSPRTRALRAAAR